MDTIFFHMDVETSGSDPATNDLFTVGGCAFLESARHGNPEVGSDLFVQLRVNQPIRWDDSTKRWWESQNAAAKNEAFRRSGGYDPVEAATAIATWVEKTIRCAGPGSETGLFDCVFVANPSGFDWKWVSWLFASTGVENPFGYLPLCLGSMMYGIGLTKGRGWSKAERDVTRSELRIERQSVRQHHALDDARHQMNEHRAVLREVARR